MIIKTAEFVCSNTDYTKAPKQWLPEYAFIGRSNVGKSSLINMLCNHKDLAKTSARPGKTQLINHFLINKNWFLVDLPGYGYAKVSKDAKQKWQKFLIEYIEKRENLMCLFILIDSRHEPQKIDVEFMTYCGTNDIPFVLVFTKMDKLKTLENTTKINHYKKELQNYWEELPPMFYTSSVNKTGQKEILEYVHENNEFFKKQTAEKDL